MNNDGYRYTFGERIPSHDIESTLLMAIWSCEAIHGEDQTRLDAQHAFDADKRTCVIDAGTAVGRDFNKFFASLIRREFGADSFNVQRTAQLSGTS